ncbi:MAG: NUDIX hydrolase [Oscillospiraceae bacterium]
MDQNQKWLNWAIELQALAQAGLFYSKDIYDIERFTRIREIAAEMLISPSGLPLERVKDLFCGDTGYQTPKLDTRAAVFQNDKILLVQEKNGLWSLPGGWVDVDLSVGENTVKEVREEAGLDVRCARIIAVQDRKKHNPEIYAYNICKVFVLCDLLGGQFRENSETVAMDWFAIADLPPLSENKTTAAQIQMCFDAYRTEHWQTLFD